MSATHAVRRGRAVLIGGTAGRNGAQLLARSAARSSSSTAASAATRRRARPDSRRIRECCSPSGRPSRRDARAATHLASGNIGPHAARCLLPARDARAGRRSVTKTSSASATAASGQGGCRHSPPNNALTRCFSAD